jgi:hypothetical protein
MSSTRDFPGGRGRGNKPRSLRKPGEIRTPEIAENNISQDDEKPPVQKLELTVNVASESGPKQLAQGLYLLDGAILYYVLLYLLDGAMCLCKQ